MIGAALFVVFGIVGGEDLEERDRTIIVTPGRIEQLAAIYQRTWRRPPTEKELRGLVDDFVVEEIYYREAVEMGIDRNDAIIRRRLRQKLEFLTDDVAELVEPADPELQAYLDAHPEDFREESTYTFRQVYLDPERYADKAAVDARVKECLAALETGQEVVGDSTLVQETFEAERARRVDAVFGDGFARQLDELTIGKWGGPLTSGRGYHLVWLEARAQGEVPELPRIRDVVEREWANARKNEVRESLNEEFLKKYEVVIEWPK
ncbi:MAG: peptidyl-prolyl cis-trans isomerase, partial [Akkermansiaceae bacterium]|nr:peptidyl-prolyl cis-trans isomerase [Akkermansiaceae bacterium]